MALHHNLTTTNVHTPYRQVFADEAARLADATVYVAADLNKKALQADTNTEYRLSATTPTWTMVGASGSDLSDDQTGTTSGAATTVLFSINTQANDTVMRARVSVIGQDDTSNDLQNYEIVTTIKRDGGGTVTVEQVDIISMFEDQAPPTDAVTFVINGNDIDVTVLGITGRGIEWRGKHQTDFLTLGGG